MVDPVLQEKLLALVRRIQQADDQAFSDFYDLTVNRLYGLVYKILGDPSDTEDVVCDAYTQIWQQAKNYHPDRGSVLGWSLLLARCRALDLYRKRRSSLEVLQDAKAQLENTADPAPEPDKIVQLFEQNNHALTGLSHLSDVQKQMLSLAFFKGLSHSEIAEATGIPLGSVKSHIKRALDTLHKKLKD